MEGKHFVGGLVGRGRQHFPTGQRSGIAGAVERLRARLSRAEVPWCPGTGTPVSTGATEHGLAWCPCCPKRVRADVAPMARYRIIAEHTA